MLGRTQTTYHSVPKGSAGTHRVTENRQCFFPRTSEFTHLMTKGVCSPCDTERPAGPQERGYEMARLYLPATVVLTSTEPVCHGAHLGPAMTVKPTLKLDIFEYEKY